MPIDLNSGVRVLVHQPTAPRVTANQPAGSRIQLVPVPGPPGPAGASVTHTQASAAAEWIFNHNLGRKPDIVVVVNNQTVTAEIFHFSNNQARIRFAAAQAGEATAS